MTNDAPADGVGLPTRPIGRTGLAATVFGLGGTGIASMYRPTAHEAATATMAAAWDRGVRLYDTAPLYGYGQSERRLGDFLREKPDGEYVLSTKVGRLLRPGARPPPGDIFKSPLPFTAAFDYSYDGAMRSFEDSLQRLGLASIDIALIHDVGVDTHGREAQPAIFRTAMDGAYRALSELRRAGLVKAVGLGVNEWHVCVDALGEGDFDVFLLAGRYTLLEQTAIETFLPLCLSRGASVLVGGVFNSGLLIDPFAATLTYDYAAAPPEIVRRARQIQEICAAHGVPLPAAALAFPLRHPAVASVLSGARSPEEVAGILDWMALEIPEALWSDLAAAGLLDPAAA
jgi:D-threo-aldose 1-dehydrogenase